MSEFSKKKIAVCIPTYNRADVISDAIESLLVQNKIKFDIHVFDNCSIDNTEELIAERFKGKVFYHKNESNIGFVGNTNKCLSLHDEYDWIGILHSDDTHLGESVYEASLYFEKYPEASTIFSDVNIINDKKEIIKAGSVNGHIFKAGLSALKRAQEMIPCSATFYRSAVIKKIGYYNADYPFSADEEYNSRMAVNYDMVVMDKVIANHKFHAGNFRIETWSDPDFLKNYENMRRNMLCTSNLPKDEIDKILNRFMSDTCIFVNSHMVKHGYKKEGKKYNSLAWNYDPYNFINPKKLLKLIVFKVIGSL